MNGKDECDILFSKNNTAFRQIAPSFGTTRYLCHVTTVKLIFYRKKIVRHADLHCTEATRSSGEQLRRSDYPARDGRRLGRPGVASGALRAARGADIRRAVAGA